VAPWEGDAVGRHGRGGCGRRGAREGARAPGRARPRGSQGGRAQLPGSGRAARLGQDGHDRRGGRAQPSRRARPPRRVCAAAGIWPSDAAHPGQGGRIRTVDRRGEGKR
jgi:hypothetical protein